MISEASNLAARELAMNATCTLSKAGLPEAIRSIVAAIGNAFNMLPAPRRAIQRFGLGRSQSGPMQSARTKESKVWRARGAIFFVTRRCDINHATWALRFWQWRLWPSLEVCGVCDTIVAHMYGNSHWGRLFATVLRAASACFAFVRAYHYLVAALLLRRKGLRQRKRIRTALCHCRFRRRPQTGSRNDRIRAGRGPRNALLHTVAPERW